jgi:hypothetical protein
LALSLVSSICTDAVSNCLDTAVGKGNAVRPGCHVSVPLLLLSVVVLAVVVLDRPVVGVGRGGVRGLLLVAPGGGGGGQLVGESQGKGEEDEGDDGLKLVNNQVKRVNCD